ncbi:hypothetical protein [Candidatus Spyradosoma sp. SGI.093]|uniref:hypothetical protein n=1 Tax=Candidatus Spyradosoma sp. SGI.093 TaxID=3420583 RepID=UPI003D07C4CF
MNASLFSSFSESVGAWWNALGWDAQIFYAVGGIALAVVLIQAALTLVGIGDVGTETPGDLAPDADAPHDAGLGLISVRTLTAFFLGFGLTGGLLLDAGTAFPWALAGAAAVGVAFMLIIFWIMKMLYGLRSSGNADIASAKGATGTVYVAIAPRRAAGGQVEVLVSGRVMTLPALSSSAEKIPAGTLVRVVEVLPPNILVVEKVGS